MTFLVPLIITLINAQLQISYTEFCPPPLKKEKTEAQM